MTATSNSAPLAGGSLSSSATAQPPQPPPGHQQQHPLPQIYDSQMQYYYGSSMPNQPIPTYTAQNGAPQQFGTPPYYQDANGQFGQVPAQQQMMTAGHPYFYMAQPQQGGQHVAQSGQPQIFYYQQPLGQMAQQAAPMYFHPMQAASTPMLSEQMSMMPQIQSTNPQQSEQLRKSGAQIRTTRTVPLTSSTPLPTSREYETVQRDRNRNSQSRYQCPIEHDDLPIDEISKITIDNHNDDTMSAEKENRFNKNRVEKLGRRGFAKPEVDSQLPHNFKTRLCMTHAAGINPCALGARCKFAHGLKELRASDIPTRYPNNKYKTKLCKNFARGGSGVCPYGLRCEFVHPSDTEFQNIPPYQRKMVEEHDSIPEDYVVARYQPRFMHTSGKATTPTKVTLKQRNVAGSMMCLSNTGRDLEAGGDFNHPEINENDLPPHLRRIRRGNPPVTRSRPSFSTKWTSVENLGLRGHY